MRLDAAKFFEAGRATKEIAAEPRVTERSVQRWRRAWEGGGAGALASAGPMSVERLSPARWQRLQPATSRIQPE